MTKIEDNYVNKFFNLKKNQETHFKMLSSNNKLDIHNDNKLHHHNNIIIDKNVISDILSSNQVSVNIKNRYSRFNKSSSQSIQIFKLNSEETAENLSKNQIKVKNIPVKITNSNIPSSKIINNSSINLSERLSKIENKMSSINSQMNSSKIFTNKDTSNNLNLDSRIKSLNDVSEFLDSKIIKEKSFFSHYN
jgi:hypothetical protein